MRILHSGDRGAGRVLDGAGNADNREAVAKALDAHVCRCTGYERIVDAIQTAGEAWKNGKHLASTEPRRHDFFGEEFGMSRKLELIRIECGTGGFGNGAKGSGIGTSPLRYRGLDQTLGEKAFVDDMGLRGCCTARWC